MENGTPKLQSDDTGKRVYRKFDKSLIRKDKVIARNYHCYLYMHTFQTVDFGRAKREEYLKFDHGKMTLLEALDKLKDFVDESDPDVDFPNELHGYQTAEAIRAAHPDKEWFQLVGLIHDVGKVLFLWNEPHWCVTGDTFVLGCKPPRKIAYGDCTFDQNSDLKDPRYNTEYGMYTPNCGLEYLLMSWGHDEYMYQVLKNHPNNNIPDEGLNMIRFHSFYPWHMDGEYWHLANEKDKRMLEWIKELNIARSKYDLYSKTDTVPNVEALKPYYEGLVDKYCPGVLSW